VVATVPVGQFGQAITVNPATRKAYAMAEPANQITQINGEGEAELIPLGPTSDTSLFARLAVNVNTNKIYAINVVDNIVFAVDGDNRQVTRIPVGSQPVAVAVNSVTNKVYVANFGDSTVTVVDGKTNGTAIILVGTEPDAIAVDSVRNRIYVANEIGMSLLLMARQIRY
jgi:YVTN family beta-propeller protein